MKITKIKSVFFVFILISVFSFSFENFNVSKKYEIKNINDDKIVSSFIKDNNYVFFENIVQDQSLNILVLNKNGEKINEFKFSKLLLVNFEKVDSKYILFGKYTFEGKNYSSLFILDDNFNVIQKNYYFIDNYTPIKMLYSKNKKNIIAFYNKFDGEKSYFKEIIYSESLIEKNLYEESEKGFININDIDIANNNIYLTGWQDKTDSKLDLYISVRNLENKILWSKTFGGKYDDKGYKIKFYDNSIIVGGTNESYNEKNNKDIWILRLNTDGNIIWSKLYDSGFLDEINDIAFNKNNIYITGYSLTKENEEDSYILKLNLKGEKEYFDLSNYEGTDIGNSIILDDKSIILSGFFVSNTNKDETTGSDSLILILNKK